MGPATPADLLNQLQAVAPADFRVDGYIDAGGQGAVFRGEYQGREAAVKLFGPHHDPRRLDREIQLLQAIDHPNLVKILGTTTVTIGGTAHPLVAYEFLHGGDLRKYLAVTAPALTTEQLLNIAADVASAVEILWQERIVHRDVKPANIVDAGTRNVLVDVGFCRHLNLSNLTLVGQGVGTQGYMSREQAQGRRNLTIHSDIFSLGITLYVLASKRHPFQGNQALIGVLKPLPLSSHRADLPVAFTGLIDQMLATVPAQRPSGLAFRFNQLKTI
jgi:eukaryotic-like serine/threonine-protein kinase